jgi:hypothetical protein
LVAGGAVNNGWVWVPVCVREGVPHPFPTACVCMRRYLDVYLLQALASNSCERVEPSECVGYVGRR